jgi:hypothetical protein
MFKVGATEVAYIGNKFIRSHPSSGKICRQVGGTKKYLDGSTFSILTGVLKLKAMVP